LSSAWAVAGLGAATGAGVGRGDLGAGGELFVARVRGRLAVAPPFVALVAFVRGIVAP
jgi:hypothetical protein